jgi:hypothetical protein
MITPKLVAVALTIASLVLSSPARAQDLRVGMSLGTSSFTFGGNDVHRDQSARTHLTIGLHAEYRIIPALSVETGLSWVPKGARGILQGFEEPITTDVRLDYLQVPALVRLTVPSGTFVRPSVIAGPALSVEARCEERLEIGAIANHIDCDDTGRVRTDWGILLGGGLAAGTGRMEVALEGRYELGLRDLDRVDAIETKSRGWTVTARVSRALR